MRNVITEKMIIKLIRSSPLTMCRTTARDIRCRISKKHDNQTPHSISIFDDA